MMKIILPILLTVLAIVLTISPVSADDSDELDRWLNSLPPMAEEDRKAFDETVRAIYHEDCNCLRYLLVDDQSIRKVPIPLSDDDRYMLTEGFKRGLIVPVPGGKLQDS